MMNAKVIHRLVYTALAVCILLLTQTASAEGAKHSVTIPKTASELGDYRYS